jgi:hypothetical protein
LTKGDEGGLDGFFKELKSYASLYLFVGIRDGNNHSPDLLNLNVDPNLITLGIEP